MRSKFIKISALAIVMATSSPVFAGSFGEFRDQLLKAHSMQLFGVGGPLAQSSTESIDAGTANANPRALATFARTLRARVVSAKANLGANIDMMALWPNDL